MLDDTPKAENRTLPRRGPNIAYRQREYLTEAEVEKLIEAARRRGRNSARDKRVAWHVCSPGCLGRSIT
jgi:hypothetical protein